jgi:hypothetical protein
MSSTRTSEAQVPLLEAEEVDEDVEHGALPNYAEATQSGQRVGFVAGAKPHTRPGKDPVSLADTSLRLGKLLVDLVNVYSKDSQLLLQLIEFTYTLHS